MTKYKITMKNEVHDEIFAIMHNINELNKGYEIGGWFFGEWTYLEEQDIAVLNLNEFVIPKQKVSKTEVDISPESMLDMIKEYGSQKMNTIVAHWHIHPFGKGKTNWSGGDENKISDWTDPNKGRDTFCFLLSSEDEIKGRIIINKLALNPITNCNEFVQEDIDNIVIERETPIMISPLIEKIRARINDKVETQVYEYKFDKDKKNKKNKKYKHNLNITNTIDRNNNYTEELDSYGIENYEEGLYLIMSHELHKHIWNYFKQSEDRPNIFFPNREAHEINRVMWFYEITDIKQKEIFMESLEIFMEEIYADLEEEKRARIIENSYIKGYDYGFD